MNSEKELPNSDIAEQAVLGLIQLNNSLADDAISNLDVPDFYDNRNAAIFSTICELRLEGKEISAQLIGAKLGERLQRVGGFSYILNLTYGLPYTDSIDSYIRIIKDKAVKRNLIKRLEATIDDVWANHNERDAEEFITDLDSSLDTFRGLSEQKGFLSFMDVATSAHEKLERLRAGENPAISFGLPSLDEFIRGGAYAGETIVLAAKTSKGKSAMMKQFAHYIAMGGNPVGIVTAEMSNEAVLFRMLSPEAAVPNWQIKPEMNPSDIDALEKALPNVANLPIYITDKVFDVFELRAYVSRLVKTKGIKVLFVDYLQLLNAQTPRMDLNRTQELALISRTLKLIAKEFGIVVFALAQFNRQANQKDESGKQVDLALHYLEGSGAIEKDADIGLLLDMEDYVVGQPERKATLEIAKNRESVSGVTIELIFNGNYLLFREPKSKLVENRIDKSTREMFEVEEELGY